jgi:hypothetical protein
VSDLFEISRETKVGDRQREPMFFHGIFLHFFLFPRRVDSAIAGPEGTKNLAGEKFSA